MCLLIVKPPGIDLPHNLEVICEEASDTNPHGSGFAKNGTIYKSPNVDPYYFAACIKYNVKREDACLIHFRMATCGLIDRDNTHPFQLADGTIFAHNGIISELSDHKSSKSDTATLASMTENYEELVEICTHLSKGYNKFAIIPPNRNHIEIIGNGTWHEGLWYSNTYWSKSVIEDNFNWTLNTEDYEFDRNLTDDQHIQLQDELTDLILKHTYKNVDSALTFVGKSK